jgi:hypothetical protein
VVISSDHLEPGAVGQVKATVETTNANGPLSKRVTIYSNDLVTPVVTVEMVMNVVLQQSQQVQQPQKAPPLQPQQPQH